MHRGIPIMRAIPILIVMIAAAVAGMAWAISSPIGSSPDEDYHLASIWCPPPAEDNGCVVTVGKYRFLTTPAQLVDAPLCYAFHADESGACIWAIPAGKVVQSVRFDSGGYPGGFYHVMHIFATDDPYAAVYRIRAANVGIAVALGALLVLGANRPTRRILAYAVASTYVPMGMFIVPAANPSSWALIGLTTTAFGLHSYWISTTRSRAILNGVLMAVGVALAASARTDAAMYAVLAVIGVTCLHYRAVRRHPLRLILPGVVPVVGVLVYLMSTQAGLALSGELGTQEHTSGGWGLLARNLIDSPLLLFGNEGLSALGWLDTPMPSIVFVPMLVVCAFLVTAGLGRLTWMKFLVALAGMLAVVAIPLYILQVSRLIVSHGVQARYILPLLPVVSLVILTGYRPSQAVRLSLPAAWVAWALVSGANCVALMVNIRRYTTGLDGPTWPGQAVEWWSTDRIGPLPTWILGSLGFAVAAWMIVRLSSGSDGVVTVALASTQAAIASGVVVADQVAITDELAARRAPAGPIPTQHDTAHPATPEYRTPDPGATRS